MLYLKTIENFSELSPDECRKAQHRAGTELLKYALIEEHGIKIDESGIILGEHGKPALKDRSGIFFNISHSGAYVVLLLSSKPCGVDIERVRPVNPRTVLKVCTGSEAEYAGDSAERFITLWTLKESYVKAVGVGLAFGLNNVEFRFDGENITSDRGGDFFSFGIEKEDGRFIISGCLLPNE